MSDNKIVLEPAALKFANDNAEPPYLPDLGPEKGRETVNSVQSGEMDKPAVDIQDITISGGPGGDVPVRIIRPLDTAGAELPVILYIHGAGWVFGNSHTHDRLIRELSTGAGAAVVFLNTACPRKLSILPLLKKSMRCLNGLPRKAPITAWTAAI